LSSQRPLQMGCFLKSFPFASFRSFDLPDSAR
jgi:hypothetical protein